MVICQEKYSPDSELNGKERKKVEMYPLSTQFLFIPQRIDRIGGGGFD
jgi:hypothetical protein